jgi:hypothetical protein
LTRADTIGKSWQPLLTLSQPKAKLVAFIILAKPHTLISFVMLPSALLVLSAFALVVLTFLVGLRLLYVRAQEMREKRVHPQAVSTSQLMATRLQNVQVADNFRNLFETPVLFYALVATAVASQHVPSWLVIGAWAFVAFRGVHSLIHCTYNRVMHRFAAFGLGFLLLVGLWAAFVIGLTSKNLG